MNFGGIYLRRSAGNLASHQRGLLRGLQEGRTQFARMMVGMTSVGLLDAWLRAYASRGQR